MWQTLLKGLGSGLAFLFDLIPSYGVAIILLTVAVRVVLLPLTIKQTRSMQAMSKLQPELKALQKKHKGNRQKLQEETMKLYKEHRVNPLGGCLPLLLQLPVFFALFSVLRATIPAEAVPATEVPLSEVRGEEVFCSPAGVAKASGSGSDVIVCDVDGETREFRVREWKDGDGAVIEAPPFIRRCTPREVGESGRVDFQCESPVGTGHLPEDSDLFADIVEDRASFLGMQLSCSSTQAASQEGIRQCAPAGTAAGGAPLVGYYGLIALMVGSTWYQTRQMQRATPQQPGAQAIGRIMPIFLGFISLTIPAGVLVYWVTTNGWQVGQQYVMLKSRSRETEAQAKPAKPERAKGGGAPEKPAQERKPAAGGPGGAKRSGGRRRARGRKKRRKR